MLGTNGACKKSRVESCHFPGQCVAKSFSLRQMLQAQTFSISSSNSWLAYIARSAFLSNLPTLVLGTSEMNAHRSGIHHLATRARRCSRISPGVTDEPGFGTTHASGR